LASGNKIKDKNKAKAKGIRIDFAKISTTNNKQLVARAKNNFWKEIFILNLNARFLFAQR